MDVHAALTDVRSSATILDGMRAGERLEDVARSAGPEVVDHLVVATTDPDPITAIAAVHALGAHGSATAGAHLVSLLDDERAHVAEHAIDALSGVVAQAAALERLVRHCAEGGFPGMLAARTLERWAAASPDAVEHAVTVGLASERDPAARAHLEELAQDLRSGARDATKPPTRGGPGLTVAQLFLHGDLDGSLRHSGQGDTGGVATLLVHLGDALLRHGARVDRVITISGSRDAAVADAWAAGATTGRTLSQDLAPRGHHYARIPLSGPSTSVSTAWSLRIQARHGIREVLRAAGRVDVIHLRMADVGSLVAAEVAAELGIPVVLTLAPDPQALLAAREADGSLTRAEFGDADRVEHLWFRDRLLRALAAQAEHLVLFPRPDVERSIGRLVGIDVTAQRERVSVVGEGIDLAALERVAKEVAGDAPRSPETASALRELSAVLDQLPPNRRGLPLAVSVGRLSPVKGMATLASTWLTEPTLRERCNLVIVGGDLDDPTTEEAAELARIREVVSTDDCAGEGLLLAGHRPNATATAWLAAAHRGVPGVCAPDGVYVCASLKEEFGIAILEAMTMGLVVVAPNSGGPATYIEDGVTGVLTDTTDPRRLADAFGRALELASSPGEALRTRRSRAGVRERFGIDTMASSLVEVYAAVAARQGATSLPRAVTS